MVRPWPRWHEGLPEEIVNDVRASLEDLQRLPYYQLMPIRRPTLVRKIQQLREAGVVMLAGTLAEGKVADIIAVRGDVLRYPSLLQDVDMVMHRGRRVR